MLTSCRVFNMNHILTELDLQPDDLPYLATLIGSLELPDNLLAYLYWDLIDEDNPLKKVKENLPSDAVLPPSELRLKCVIKFIQDNRERITDIKWLSEQVFEKSTKLSVEEGEQRLKDIIEFYKDILLASKASRIKNLTDEDELEWSPAGYPIPSESKNKPNHLNRYKKRWHINDVSKHSKKKREPKEAGVTTIEDPEKVIKEGTLEEAAQALEQLELKESKAEQHKDNENTESQPTIADEEKPSTTTSTEVGVDEKSKDSKAEQEEEEEANEVESDVDDESLFVEYPREIKVTPVVADIHEDVLSIARKRHQSGQMCQEILNLLTKGELSINMTMDDETPTARLPIPLIYRPLRRLMYGVLFGAKLSIADDVESEEAAENKEENETEDSKVKDDVASKENEEETIENKTEESEETNEMPDETQQKEVDDTQKSESEAKEKEKVVQDNEPAPKEDKEPVPKEAVGFVVKEWCVHSDKNLKSPDCVTPKALSWGVPPLKKLWFGTDSEDNANRLKAFLSVMKSDTVNMSNTAMVPQRLMLLCCVLRYLIQQDSKVSVLTKQDIDAFLAQALSAQLTTEHNTQSLANLKLNQVDARCIQLSSIFMSGIENAIIANDACGSPVPWEFCCPWNFFDGKLFHTKWLQSTMNFSITDLCEGKPHIAEKLERLRWCVTEGLDSKYSITGLEQTKKFFSPFGTPVSMHSTPFMGNMRPPGVPPMRGGGRSRGTGGKQMVHGSGGTLHVAGVPVAHWGGNKAGVGYSKNAPSVLVGGPNSVDLPSSHKRGRGGRGRPYGRGGRGSYHNKQNRQNIANNAPPPPPPPSVGRGLLETPVISPWQQGFGYEEVQNANFKRYMKGVQKVEEVRSNISKLQHQRQVYSNRTRYQHNQQQQQQQQQQKFDTSPTPRQPLQHNSYYSQQPVNFNSPRGPATGSSPSANGISSPSNGFHHHNNKPDTYGFNNKNMWVGKGRGMSGGTGFSPTSPNYNASFSSARGASSSTRGHTRGGYRSQHQQLSHGRGNWMPSNVE
eukprot:TCONS_00012098-protein